MQGHYKNYIEKVNVYDGIIIEPNMYYYIGQINNDNQKHGVGTYHWPDGMKFYYGEFKNDVKQGYGTFYKRNTKMHYQGFINDNLFNGYGVRYNEKMEEVCKGYFRNSSFLFADDLTWNEKSNIYNYLTNSDNQVAMYLSQTEVEIKLLCWKNKVNKKHYVDMPKQYQKHFTLKNFTSTISYANQVVVSPEIINQYVREYLYKYYNIPFQRSPKISQRKKVKTET